LVVLLVPAFTARAEAGLFDRLDPAAFDAADIRLLQTALVALGDLDGDFGGDLDGNWSSASAQAFGRYAAREFEDTPLNLHAAALVIGFLAEIEAQGWTVEQFPDLGISMAMPERALEPPEREDDGRRWWSRRGSLTLLTHRFAEDEARAWHRAASSANSEPAALEIFSGETVMSTSGFLDDGRRFFTRSDRTAGQWATVFIASGDDQVALMNLMRASLRLGGTMRWDLPAGGRLEALIDATLDLSERLDMATASASATPRTTRLTDEGAEVAASGTGFFVTDRVLVTAAHVVGECAAIGLVDGTPLRLIAEDRALDVAALVSGPSRPAWLPLAPEAPARLGQQVHALGFPYYAIAGTSLHLTGGNVSALAGVNDDGRFFSFTAPVQPGSSGGPLIDPGGRVLGVVVSRLSERFIAEATGTLPQNVNYALRTEELAAFLERHGLHASATGPEGYDLSADGVPTAVAEAVVPVLCL
jgi:S1-C subfamily serine protease